MKEHKETENHGPEDDRQKVEYMLYFFKREFSGVRSSHSGCEEFCRKVLI